MENKSIEPFTLAVPQQELDDLGRRLALTRWPDRETVGDWSQGAPLQKVRALCDYWRDRYDWRRCAAMLNGWSQHRTSLDGLGIHFLHIRSPQADALTHDYDPRLARLSGLPGSAGCLDL